MKPPVSGVKCSVLCVELGRHSSACQAYEFVLKSGSTNSWGAVRKYKTTPRRLVQKFAWCAEPQITDPRSCLTEEAAMVMMFKLMVVMAAVFVLPSSSHIWEKAKNRFTDFHDRKEFCLFKN